MSIFEQLCGAASVIVTTGLLLSACSPTTSPDVQSSDPHSETSSPSETEAHATEGSEAPANRAFVSLERIDNRVNLKSVDQPGDSSVLSATAVPDGDTGLLITMTLTDISTPVALTVDDPPGSDAVLVADGTVGFVASDGTLAVGVTAPSAADATGTVLKARWTTTSEATPASWAQLAFPSDATPTYPVTVTVHVGASVVTGVDWGEREGGESLAVTPSAWGRVSGLTGKAYGWADVVALAPEADTTVMETQFLCHFVGAPDKATWNLEPWRPDLSFVEYALARCNPT